MALSDYTFSELSDTIEQSIVDLGVEILAIECLEFWKEKNSDLQEYYYDENIKEWYFHSSFCRIKNLYARLKIFWSDHNEYLKMKLPK